MKKKPEVRRWNGFWAETISILAIVLPFTGLVAYFYFDLQLYGYTPSTIIFMVISMIVLIGTIGIVVPFKICQFLGLYKYQESWRLTDLSHNCSSEIILPMSAKTARDHVDMFMKQNENIGKIAWFSSFRGNAVYEENERPINVTFVINQPKNKDSRVILTFVPVMNIYPKSYALRNEVWQTMPEELLRYDDTGKRSKGKKLKPDYLEGS